MTVARTPGLWSPFGLHYGWVIVSSAVVINLAAYPLSPNVFAFFLVPMSEDLGWSRGEMSWALTFRLLVAGISAPYIGQLIDRFGSRWLAAGAGIIAGGCLIALSSVNGLAVLYLLYGLSGVAGFGVPAGTLLTLVPIGKWFVRHRGPAMAIATSGIAVGTVVGIQEAQWIIGSAGWRTAWIALGVGMLLVVTTVSAVFMRRVPEDHGLAPVGLVARAPGTPAPAATARHAGAPEVHWTRGQAMRSSTTWVILAATVLWGFALSGTLLYRVSFWHDIGMPPGLVAIGTAADPFTVIFSALLFGAIAERIPVRFLGLIAGLGFATSMLPMILTHGETYSIFAHNITWGFFAGAYVATNNLIWVTYYGRRSLGAIQGIALPAGVAANALSAPAFGFLLDGGVDPRLVWMMSMALFAFAGVLLFTTRPPKLTNASIPHSSTVPAS